MQIWEQFVNYAELQFTPLEPKPGQKTRGYKLVAEIGAFDIESTRFEDIEQSCMYVWQFSIDNKVVIMGRTWEQFTHMLKELKKQIAPRRMIVFVHNLSYEFQFLAGIYHFFDYEVFATESRKVLEASMYNTFMFRCSYRLFNMSLDAVTRKYNCQYRKRSGIQFDYEKKRTPTTALDRKELLYCVYDVLGLIEAVRAQMELHEDNLYSLPYTQTGYVRREAKRLMRPEHFEILECFPSLDVFKVLRNAYRGGDTHANRFFAGEVIHKVHGNDVSSEYPAQQVLEQYPRTPFQEIGSASLTVRYIEKLLSRGKALLMIVEFYGLSLRCWWDGFPYISSAKALGRVIEGREDNGRILEAAYVRLALTDIDYKIILQQYQADRVEIVRAWSAGYGPMYDGIITLNKQLFKAKTELKGVKGQELYYAKAKEQLNAIYGMSCQNPVTDLLLFKQFGYTPEGKPEEKLIEKARKAAFLTYQLGVWTTANARAELRKFLNRAGDNAVYCDTDSVMYVGDVDFSDFNEDYMRRCEEAGEGAYAYDSKGRKRYMGVFECEDVPGAGCKYERFITLGAKRYAFEKPVYPEYGPPKLELGITVSGVSKKSGAAELKRKGGLVAFKEGFVFEDSGKLEAVYNDEEHAEPYFYDGEELRFTSNVTLRPTSYTFKLSDDYADLIARCSLQDILAAERDWKIQKDVIAKLTKNK